MCDRFPGAPQEALQDYIRMFLRVTGKQGRTSGGAGIVLAITFHAVGLHRGTTGAMNRSTGAVR